MVRRTGPYCECGECDSIGRETGVEIKLPVDAWKVAGEGDLDRIAVAPGHHMRFVRQGVPVEDHGGWVAVGP